ncbi:MULTISPECIES: plastocyanin/azurin family copper-binding protein [unclassified Haladaptatus]|uniref:cupredoxin domain-containing protein n=1 Tax=unclassified Haladaptatus TaxID=2622732 RepID=UPI0023E82C26|nr:MULTISPECIES: plastocyanin/azurin family copper-binding protein [unclassified Haladaptatus]
MSRETGEQTRDWQRTRRTVLRTLGAGTAVASFGGVATAQTKSDEKQGTWGLQETDCPPCIDDLAGYASLTTELDVPTALRPQHTVEMRVDDADVLFPEEADGEQTPADEQTDTDGQGEGTEGFPDFYFDPVGIAVEAGDVIEFQNPSADLHTVTAIHPRFFGLPQRIPESAAPFSSPPVMTDENWLYRFTEPGVYDIQCLPHFELGMVMRVVVTKKSCEAPEAPAGSDQLPPPVAAVLDADRLRPENIVENGPVAWTDLEGEIPTFDPEELFSEDGGGEPGEEPTDGEGTETTTTDDGAETTTTDDGTETTT